MIFLNFFQGDSSCCFPIVATVLLRRSDKVIATLHDLFVGAI